MAYVKAIIEGVVSMFVRDPHGALVFTVILLSFALIGAFILYIKSQASDKKFTAKIINELSKLLGETETENSQFKMEMSRAIERLNNLLHSIDKNGQVSTQEINNIKEILEDIQGCMNKHDNDFVRVTESYARLSKDVNDIKTLQIIICSNMDGDLGALLGGARNDTKTCADNRGNSVSDCGQVQQEAEGHEIDSK